MKNTYFDLIEQSFYFPQEGFDLRDDFLTFHGVSLKHLIEKHGTPFRFIYLPKIGDQIKKARNLFNRSIKNNGIGFFQIGGGIAGDFPICVVPMLYQDLEKTNTPFWSYFCQISDSTTSYGSYSGAVPNEKITWGKLDAHTPKFIVESDATIVAPLIFAYLLGW